MSIHDVVIYGDSADAVTASISANREGVTENFYVEVFQDEFGTDVRLAGFLPDVRQIKSMKELILLDHQSSPSRLILVQDDCEEGTSAADNKIVVAGAEAFASWDFASISRALLNLSVAMLDIGSEEV